jgi:hypothetical protein
VTDPDLARDDLECSVLKRDRGEVRHATAELGVSKIIEWALAPSNAAPQPDRGLSGIQRHPGAKSDDRPLASLL